MRSKWELTATEIRDMAIERGVTCSKMWDELFQEEALASSMTSPGDTSNTSQSN